MRFYQPMLQVYIILNLRGILELYYFHNTVKLLNIHRVKIINTVIKTIIFHPKNAAEKIS